MEEYIRNRKHQEQVNATVQESNRASRRFIRGCVQLFNTIFMLALSAYYGYMLYGFGDSFVSLCKYRYIPFPRETIGMFFFYRIAQVDAVAFYLSLLVLFCFFVGLIFIWHGYLVPGTAVCGGSLSGFLFYLERVSSFGFGFAATEFTKTKLAECFDLFILTIIHYVLMRLVLPGWVLPYYV